MKKILYTTTAFVLCGGIVQANAACIATPSCTTLGYTSTSSCTGGIKCPFGNYWNCSINELTNKITELEEKIKNYQWGVTDCMVGTILYSDKTCSNVLVTGKTPIGIVVYDDGQGHRQAIALEDISDYFFSAIYKRKYIVGKIIEGCEITIPTISNFSFSTTADEAFNDYDSCGNTAKLVAASSDFMAANTIHKYSTEGTSAGDWCLPAAGILKSIRENYQMIQNSLNIAGGSELEASLSSSMKDERYYWYMASFEHGTFVEETNYIFTDDGEVILEPGFATGTCYSTHYARPVLEF